MIRIALSNRRKVAVGYQKVSVFFSDDTF